MSVAQDLGKAGITVYGPHDSSVAYEKNTIVENEGDGYISKQAVPVGTALSNTAYWTLLCNGFSSAEIVSAVNAWLDAHPEATTTVQDGAVTTAKLADGAITLVKLNADIHDDVAGIPLINNALKSLEDFKWSAGFINTNGNVDSPSNSARQHSEYLLCPENTSIEYIAETDHNSVFGISFYDANKTLISGVKNNGTIGTAQTVTSPVGTVYCRLSTKATILADTYYKPATEVLPYYAAIVRSNKTDLGNRTYGYVRFGTDGSIRGDVESVTGLIYVKVVNADYQLAVQYYNAGGTVTTTAWGTEFDLRNYKNPTTIKIRKSDNSAMAKGTANQAVIGIYLAGLATNEYVFHENETAYVDGTDGSDSNNGVASYSAFKTIQKAIDLRFKKILVREGTYTGGINLDRANGVEIKINKEYSTFDASTANTNPKIIIDCDDTLNNGVRINKSSNCVFEDIEVTSAAQSGWYVYQCEGLKFSNCIAHDCPTGMGFEIYHTNADFYNCGCYNIGTMGGGEHHDGFNIHGTGTTNFFNCWANTCEDDGISHHDACYGLVSGGEWYNCGKGGVCTPTHGAHVDVTGVYVHDCDYGIYAGNDTASLAKTFNISNSVLKGNATKDIYVTNNTANIWNCIYDTIDHSGTGSNNILTNAE